MRLDLLKSVVRNALRTANRRIKQYNESGIDNPTFTDLINSIKNRPYFGKNKRGEDVLKMGGLDRRNLEELFDVTKNLKNIETPRQYNDRYKSLADKYADGDINSIARALRTFRQLYGDRYEVWIQSVVDKQSILSKGDTLAMRLDDIIKEGISHEYTDSEVSERLQKGNWSDF